MEGEPPVGVGLQVEGGAAGIWRAAGREQGGRDLASRLPGAGWPGEGEPPAWAALRASS